MTNWLNTLLVTSNGRPLTAAEGERVAEYGESLPDRLAAARRLEESHKWLAKQLADVIGPKAAEWGLPREALVNDFVQSQFSIRKLAGGRGLQRCGLGHVVYLTVYVFQQLQYTGNWYKTTIARQDRQNASILCIIRVSCAIIVHKNRAS